MSSADQTPKNQKPADAINDKNDLNVPGQEGDVFPEYPEYPMSEDIYNNAKKSNDDSSEDITLLKDPSEPRKHGGELDVPGAELDDKQELTGSEDEENNYYSLGGDEHND